MCLKNVCHHLTHGLWSHNHTIHWAHQNQYRPWQRHIINQSYDLTRSSSNIRTIKHMRERAFQCSHRKLLVSLIPSCFDFILNILKTTRHYLLRGCSKTIRQLYNPSWWRDAFSMAFLLMLHVYRHLDFIRFHAELPVGTL